MSLSSGYIQTIRRRWAAPLIIVTYTIVALVAEFGIGVGGQGLDPVWSSAQARGTLRVAVDYGFRPFTDIQGDQPQGYDIDLARALAEKLGLRAEFVPSGLDSIYDDLASGKADLAASALPYAPEQGWRVLFSEFYFNAGQVLVLPISSQISDQADLAGQRVGVALGSDADTYVRMLERSVGLSRDSSFETPADALAALRAGSLDAVITDNLSALIELNKRPGLRIVEPALTPEFYALGMSVRAFRLHSEVNRALAELRREGFFERNGAKWFTEPSQRGQPQAARHRRAP
jgi:ABC-type amino acid transport substrate-binding protein